MNSRISLAFILAVLAGCGQPHPGPGKDAAEPKGTVATRISADKLVQEYAANEIAADSKYKGKSIEVSGNIVQVGRDPSGKPYLVLHDKYAFSLVRCLFDNSKDLEPINPGQRLVVRGRCDGKADSIGTVGLSKCFILPGVVAVPEPDKAPDVGQSVLKAIEAAGKQVEEKAKENKTEEKK